MKKFEQGYVSVRLAFLLPALLVLLVPITNYLSIQQTATELDQQQRQEASNLLGTVNSLIKADLSLLGDHEVYHEEREPIFVHQASVEIDLDGRLNDWRDIPAISLAEKDLLIESKDYSPQSLSVELRIQESPTSLYLYFDVRDESVIYREISHISIHRNDHIRLAAIDQSGNFQRYTIATTQPGTVYGRVVSTGGRALRNESRIEGFWRATDLGYQLEVKIDRSLISERLALNIADVDQVQGREIVYLLGTGATDDPSGSSALIHRSKRLEQLFAQISKRPMSFADRYDNVLAGNPGEIERETGQGHWVLNIENEYGTLTTLLTTSEVDQFKQTAYEQLIWLSILSGVFGLLLCWWLSTVTLNRLNKLGSAIEAVVDDQGRVKGSLEHPAEHDAIGDLGERFVVITERLRQYNEYLELLSRRLAHELRTPVSVVRSSLEHLASNVDEDNQKFVQRANNGVARLTNILNSMSEASRLEQSLDKDEVIVFNLNDVVRGCFEGYEHAFPNQTFELITEQSEIKITGIPELLAQMLDKLIDNAEQFSEQEQPIILRLSEEQDQAVLRVSNSGPSLPDKMSQQLFDPMISVRDSTASEDSHLGLGLYVARMISQFHGGSIELKNRDDRQGVVVIVTIPLLRITSKLA